ATDFRLNSPSRYFSDTTFLNSNENFSMHPQFLVWCLTFGAQFTLMDTIMGNGSVTLTTTVADQPD
ncbi:hypothetical protein QJN77_23345, partial [Escherichia coli]|uniref:hypothetical protein n=1 Tax=Escherichia coli TaxID=562 RepID=UPI003004F68D